MIDVVWGAAQEKPMSSRALADALSGIQDLSGYLYIGYPVMGSPTGPMKFDAVLISKQTGLVAFDLVEGLDIGEFQSRQDEIATMLEVKLKPYPDLKKGRELKFDINVVTFAPAKGVGLPASADHYYIANRPSLATTVSAFEWNQSEETYKRLVAAIQVVTTIRSGKQKRELKKAGSRGNRLKGIEDSIANLDQQQSQAVIETVDGIQRIRGLAGSGKTIVLALKVAYLHAQNESWRIGVTFNTRSLKEQFRRLINTFTIEQTGSEPDWEKIDILNAWGGPGAKERDGIYHKFCREHGITYYDFLGARNKFGEGNEFAGACGEALTSIKDEKPIYDALLVDEAQDFPPQFLRLCYRFLQEPRRLVYAYDELQSLTGNSVLPPEELFGVDSEGKPLVRLNVDDTTGPRQDIILEKCYRNSRPILATAHALGFGVYRDGGVVQFFEQDSLWTDVGYVVEAGELVGGKEVILTRTPDTSPLFLENHSPIDDLIQFYKFENAAEQAQWLVDAIRNGILSEELRPEDIVVINPDPITTQKQVGPIRELLYTAGINSELAGVSTSADIFTKAGAVTFTGIFRAKGNEAGMVYIINAQDCYSGWSQGITALKRNRLFTAITRSTAWVRVLGIGKNMQDLIEEWENLKAHDYRLQFIYPTSEQKKDLRLINKELVVRKNSRKRRLEQRTGELFDAVLKGELDADRLIEDIQKIKYEREKK